jgi:recombination protein RecR
MLNEEYPSKLLGAAVEALANLPGIGQRTALRLSLHLLREAPEQTDALAEALLAFRKGVKRCALCHNISDKERCVICEDPSRDHGTVCVVENVQDVMAIEATGQYRGRYHVLGGLISPIDGISPSDLEVDSLVKRVNEERISEIILALSPTMEGDTTAFYISRRLEGVSVKLTTIARGVSVGDALEYADEVTLGRSIVNRVPFNN